MNRSQYYIMQKKHEDYLMHHGVEGQKWGVRHGPPYPIQDKILRAGTKLNSVSPIKSSNKYKNQKGRMLYTYNPNDPHDVDIYKGPFTRFLKMCGCANVFEHEFQTMRDLKMPTSKERLDEFVKLYNESTGKTREKFTSELNRIYSALKNSGSSNLQKGLEGYNLTDGMIKTAFGNFPRPLSPERLQSVKLDAKSAKAAYRVFNHNMEASHNYEICKAYIDNMKKKYDAMVDDNNQGIYNNAHDPIIIFDPTKDLQIVNKNGKRIGYDENEKHLQNVKNRQNGQVLL